MAQRFYSDFGLDVRSSGNVLELKTFGHDAHGGQGLHRGVGLGRHVLGSNYFRYIRDPWRSYAEYSSDIDYIPATQRWLAGQHDPEDSFYLWGPEPPADFTINLEAETN